MSQNRKRRVTYGKSPLNRLEPYTQGLGDSARASTSRISPISESATSTTPSVRTSQSSHLSKSSNNSRVTRGGNEDEDEGDEPTPQKRRKSLHEEAYIDPTLRRMNSHAAVSVGVNLGNAGPRNNISSLPKHPDRDNASGGGDTSRSPTPDIPFEAKSINRPPYSYWRSARRQKPASRLRDDRKGSSSTLGTSQKLDSASPRKRLIDSLGTADSGGSEAFTPMSHYVPKQLYPSDEADSTSARWRLARNPSESRTCDPKHPQRSPPAPVPSSMLRSSGVTYSRQRSFLNDSLSLTDFQRHDVKNSHQFETKAESLNIRSSRISPEEDDAHDSKPVRSIHELRRAGDNARFREVIDSIFEDIEDKYNSKSGRCCALAELCGKLLDSQFVHRFSEQGFDERLVNCTLNDLDLISASLALSAHRLIIVGGHTSRVFSDSLWARIRELPPAVLDTEDDILILARKPSIGLSKTAQASIRDVRSHLLPAMGSPSSCLSPQLLALECIKSSLVVLRGSGNTIRPFSTLLLGKLVDLIAENAIKDLNSSTPKVQLQFLDRIFLILEDYSVISGPFDYNHCRCFHRLVQFHNILNLDHHDRRQASMSYIRVILNLTNKEPTLCDSFATPDIVCGLADIVTTEFRDISRELCHQDDGTLNEVILALGTLINLAEKTKQSRAILISSNNRAVPFFRQLLEQFSGSVGTMDQAHSVADVHVNVVAGYLSILLLTICLDQEARHLVNEFLDGGGLTLILSTAEKFLQYHREVEKDTGPIETWEQGEARLTTRLGHIIDQICRSEGLAHTVHRY